uniref:hypothetical protein n=1 Tax=uncultured Actinomyces sp. TaxID=249061 RepID=UPI0028D115EC
FHMPASLRSELLASKNYMLVRQGQSSRGGKVHPLVIMTSFLDISRNIPIWLTPYVDFLQIPWEVPAACLTAAKYTVLQRPLGHHLTEQLQSNRLDSTREIPGRQ